MNWAECRQSTSRVKYYINADKYNEKCFYTQVNYFFRFTLYQGDYSLISNLVTASVCARKVKLKYAAKLKIPKMALHLLFLLKNTR